MKTKITEKQLRQLVRESLQEVANENKEDEGRFGNWLSSLGKGIQGTVRGGLDQGRQMYNQNMAQRSQADSDEAEKKAAEFRTKQNAGYKDIPEVQKIQQKYDGKIAKLNQQIDQLNQQISSLDAQKKSEMQQARKGYMSKMGKQVSKFNNQRDSYANTAASAASKGEEMMNRRRASLGLDPVGQQGAQQYKATGTDNLYESKLDRIIRESIKRNIVMK